MYFLFQRRLSRYNKISEINHHLSSCYFHFLMRKSRIIIITTWLSFIRRKKKSSALIGFSGKAAMTPTVRGKWAVFSGFIRTWVKARRFGPLGNINGSVFTFGLNLSFVQWSREINLIINHILCFIYQRSGVKTLNYFYKSTFSLRWFSALLLIFIILITISLLFVPHRSVFWVEPADPVSLTTKCFLFFLNLFI